MTTLLEIKDLRVKYGNIEALHGISFNVNEGEIVTLIGANGAGKTTTLLSISRLPPPEAPKVISGDICWKNESILDMPPHKVISDLHLALVPRADTFSATLPLKKTSNWQPMPAKTQSKMSTATMIVYSTCSRALPNAASSAVNPSPVENSRCWPWDVPSCPNVISSCLMNRPWGWHRC